MSKDAYYFSHDSNARNDQRLMMVRMKYGMEGYGIYFGIIEILREQSNYYLYKNEFTTIAYDLRVDEAIIEDIILNYGLFVIDGVEYPSETFHSKSLSRRMEKLDLIKQKRAEAGRKGGKSKPIAKQVLNKDSKEKDSKGKDINERYDLFEDDCRNYQSLFGEDTINDIMTYWTEPNKSNTKMKFEMQTTWDTKRRLKRWEKNNFSSTVVSSLDKEISEKNKNIKKQSVKLKEDIKRADEEATDFVPDLNAMMNKGI